MASSIKPKNNKMKKFITINIFVFLLFIPYAVFAQSISHQGTLSGWLTIADENTIGFRYLPEIGVSQSIHKEKSIDAEVSLNAYTWTPIDSLDNIEDNADIEFYRAWLRYSAQQIEIRLGLQKINFGPAKIMRSLMWFDRINIHDPLKLTDGVYALLGRYYFLNNANIWVWGLYGNKDLKGLEFAETNDTHPEMGGRYQFPVPRGEFAFTYHCRQIDREYWNEEMTSIMTDGLENRYAVDGNWDIGIGLWFEASAGEIKINNTTQMRQDNLTIGSDYTFHPGIHLLYEHFIQSTDLKEEDIDETNNFSALSIDYNFGIIDTVTVIGYYDWDREKTYSYLTWQRTYDNWKINLIGFSNSKDSDNTFSGEGVQCLVTYNY